MGNKSACRGILCYVHLVQRALCVCMTFQASLVKMRRLYEVISNVSHSMLGHAHMLTSSTVIIIVRRVRCAKVYIK